MRGLLALVFALLVATNTVNSGAIYRRYRELELPVGGQSDAQSLPGENYVSELRKNQIPVQVVEVIEPVLVVKPIENLRSVEPQISIAEPEPAAVITNEIIPEKLEKLEENLETVRAIEQAVIAQEQQELQQPIAEPVIAIVEQGQGQGQQQLRNIEPEAPAVPAILLVEEAALPLKKEEPLIEKIDKILLPEIAALPVELPAALPEALPEILPKEPLALAIIDQKKPEELKPLAAELPQLKAIKAEEPTKDIIPENLAAQEVDLPAAIEKQSDLKSLEEQVAPAEVQPQLKVLKEEAPLLLETPKLEELLAERKEEILEKKQEEIKEEKKEILKEAIQEAIKEDLKQVLKEKSQAEVKLDPKDLEAPISGRQAVSADPGPTTARPVQPGFIQQLVQNTPLGQLLNNFNGANNQAAPEQNTPVATAATFIQALQNTTSQITNSIQQGFQQQLQSLQTTFTGQQPQQVAVSSDAAAPAAPTPRPQGPFQSIVTSFLGQQGQQQAAPAPAPQGGPLQGILNLFGGNRVPSASPSSSTPAAEPVKDEAAPVEAAAPAAPAAEEISPESARDSVESADDSLEAAKPDEIVVNDDDSHE